MAYMPSVINAHYVECRYAECRGAITLAELLNKFQLQFTFLLGSPFLTQQRQFLLLLVRFRMKQ
jgi:hypothetical protein